MNSKRSILAVAFAALLSLSLSSCRGTKSHCITNCGGGGPTLNLVLTDTPPTGVTILSFTLPISGISLTPSTGSAVSVYPGGTFELTRLQSDTSGIAANISVPAGTYTKINVNLGTSSGVYINSSGAAITTSAGTCQNGAVCTMPAGAATQISVPINLTLSNSAQWLGIDFNLNNAITTAGGMTVDFSQANVITVDTAPPIGTLPGGDTAYIDDFTGAVTAISSTAITVNSTARGSLTAVVSSSTPVFDPQSFCGSSATISCVKVGSIVSFQGVLSSSGTITATSLDLIDSSTSPADEVEGTIYPATCNGGSNFGMILSDSSISSSSSPFAAAKFGQAVCLNVNQVSRFIVDPGILTGQSGAPTSSAVGFQSANDLVAGQTVRAKISSATSGTNVINATASALILRNSRITATVNTAGSPNFTLNGLPAYITSIVTSAQVATYSNATLFENVANVSSISASNVVSISALFLNPGATSLPFHAAKVRLQ